MTLKRKVLWLYSFDRDSRSQIPIAIGEFNLEPSEIQEQLP